MNPESQKQQIVGSLKAITGIFKQCDADYRILGSVVLVAHLKKVFRRINDIDILLDARAKDCVFEKLKGSGFEIEKKRKAGFSWFEANKERHLGLTFLLIGEFTKDYFSWRFLKFFELRMRTSYITPTAYDFEDISFVGIPISSAAAGIRQSFFNPKRALDAKVLQDELTRSKIKVYNNISVHLGGIKLPYLYDAFSALYNMYGGIRVLFGRPYEVWK